MSNTTNDQQSDYHLPKMPDQSVSKRSTDFEVAQREAKALASSDLVPKDYKNNIANTLLAMEVAHRVGASPFAVMQNLHIVQGRPSWSASFLIACVNSCGRFSPLRFETRGGDDASKKEYAARAVSTDKESGKDCTGAWITWAMVDAEGWSKKAGSKWMTMPEQMFMYRAAAFWSRVFAPEISLGMHTSDEMEDVKGRHSAAQTTISLSPAQMAEAKAEIAAGNATVEDITDKIPNLDPAQLDELSKHAAK